MLPGQVIYVTALDFGAALILPLYLALVAGNQIRLCADPQVAPCARIGKHYSGTNYTEGIVCPEEEF